MIDDGKTNPTPHWVFEIWALGAGDIYCAEDKDLPITKLQRTWWYVRGYVLHFLFGFWWWAK